MEDDCLQPVVALLIETRIGFGVVEVPVFEVGVIDESAAGGEERNSNSDCQGVEKKNDE